MIRRSHCLLALLLLSLTVFAQDDSPTAPDSSKPRDSATDEAGNSFENLELQKREIELQQAAAQEGLGAIRQQLANPSPALSKQDRIKLESEQAKLRVQLQSFAEQ